MLLIKEPEEYAQLYIQGFIYSDILYRLHSQKMNARKNMDKFSFYLCLTMVFITG